MAGKIVNHVPRLLKEKGPVDVAEFSHDLRVAHGTAASWADGKPKRYDEEILAKLCDYFDCGVGDLLEYVPEE